MAVFKVYDGSVWVEVPILDGTPGGELGGTWPIPTVDATHSGSPHHNADEVIDDDADTGIEVEQSPDEDIIRFKVAATEVQNIDATRVTFGSGITAHRFNATSMTFEDLLGGEVFFFDATQMRIQRDLDLNGVIAIGAAPISQIVAINVDQTIAPSSGIARAANFIYQFSPTAPGLESDGIRATVKTAGSQPMTVMRGAQFGTQHQGTGTLTTLIGGQFGVSSGGLGDITNAFGGRFIASIGHAITMNSLQGIDVAVGASVGTIANVFGINVNFPTFSGASIPLAIALILQPIPTGPTNRYGISQEGAAELNWFRGSAQFGGSSRPTAIGGGTSQLALAGTTKDFLPPRMTTAQVATWLGTSPQAGGMIYDTTRDALVVEETVNSVRRALAQRTNWYNVMDFGAVGDGATDDAAAIQAAIDAAASAGGGLVYFPEGIYLITVSIKVTTAGISFEGDGFSSVVRVNTAGVDGVDAGVNAHGFHLHKMRFEAGAAMTDAVPAGAAIHIRNSREVTLDLFWIDSVAQANRWKYGVFVDDIGAGTDSHHFQMTHFNIQAISSIADASGWRMAFGGWGFYVGYGTLQTQQTRDGTVYSPEGKYGIWLNGGDGGHIEMVESIDFEQCLRYESTGGGQIATQCKINNASFESEGHVDGRGAFIGGLVADLRFDMVNFFGGVGASSKSCEIVDPFNPVYFTSCWFLGGRLSQMEIRADNTDGVESVHLTDCGLAGGGGPGKGLIVDIDDCVEGAVYIDGATVLSTSDGIEVLGSDPVILKIRDTDFRNASPPINYANTGGQWDFAVTDCLPAEINTDQPYNALWVYDDFVSGTIETGEIGALGWSFDGGLLAYTYVANHPGVLDRSTGSTINTIIETFLQPVQAAALFSTIDPTYYFEMMWIYQVIESSGVDHRIGMAVSAGIANPRGLFFERLAGEANWFAIARDGVGVTRVDTGVAFSADTWYTLEMRRTNATTIEYLINRATSTTVAANIETLRTGPYMAIRNTVAANRAHRLDAFSMRIPQIGR